MVQDPGFEGFQLFLVQDFGLLQQEFLADKCLGLFGQASLSLPELLECLYFEGFEALVQDPQGLEALPYGVLFGGEGLEVLGNSSPALRDSAVFFQRFQD